MEKDVLYNIKSMRIEKGLSQKDMANKLGFSQNNYSKIEKGLVELTVKRLYEISEIFKVNVTEILGEEVLKPSNEINKSDFQINEEKQERMVLDFIKKYYDSYMQFIIESISVKMAIIEKKYGKSNDLLNQDALDLLERAKDTFTKKYNQEEI